MNIPEPGDRIRLVRMPNDPDPIPPGSSGTVISVREFDPPIPSSHSEWVDGRPVKTQLPAPPTTYQIDIDWDNGRGLMVCLPGDEVAIIDRNDERT